MDTNTVGGVVQKMMVSAISPLNFLEGSRDYIFGATPRFVEYSTISGVNFD